MYVTFSEGPLPSIPRLEAVQWVLEVLKVPMNLTNWVLVGCCSPNRKDSIGSCIQRKERVEQSNLGKEEDTMHGMGPDKGEGKQLETIEKCPRGCCTLGGRAQARERKCTRGTRRMLLPSQRPLQL